MKVHLLSSAPADVPSRRQQGQVLARQIEELMRIREEADNTALHLIAILDDADGDADQEDADELDEGDDNPDTEPSLGYPEMWNQAQRVKTPGLGDDLEAGDEKEGDELDRGEGCPSDLEGEEAYS